MSFKVAVVSSNGSFIDQHFGQALSFLIFEIKENGEFKLIESRDNIPPSDNLENHKNALAFSAELIFDCNDVIASKFGPGALKALKLLNIQAYVVNDEINVALTQLFSSKLKPLSIKDVLSPLAVSV